MEKYFLSIDLPIYYEKKILSFQKNYPSNKLPFKLSPHITVKSPIGFTNHTLNKDLIREVCSNFSSFEFSVSKPDFFGKDVLFLSVFSEKIKFLHKEIVDLFSYSEEMKKNNFELGNYTPHITLGLTSDGMTFPELLEMKNLAEKSLYPFPVFQAFELCLYGKKDGIWEKVESFLLKK